jgi:hypothetical protein
VSRWLEKVFKFLCSLKLAVIVILLLAAVSAVGTILEARYDAEYAQKLVYQSPYMYGVMILLCINLIAVMVDRWPWKKHQIGFVMAHVGIILTLLGALITQKLGVDGTMSFSVGESRQRVTVKERDLVVYGSLDGNQVRPILQMPTDFLRHRPSEKHPTVVQFGQDKIEIVEYVHLAFREERLEPSDRVADGPAVRFQLKNGMVNMTQWLHREKIKPFEALNLGPASIVLSDGSYKPKAGVNEVILSPSRHPGELRYAVYDRNNLLKTRGVVKESEGFQLGWMGLEMHILRFLPKAFQKVTYTRAESSSPLAHSAIRFRFRGAEYWLGIGSLLRLYTEDKMFVVAFVFRQLDLGFPLTLKKFEIGHYQGTERASSYQSVVEKPDHQEVLVSMNEPLKLNGFTFYQASFEKDEQGKPVASVLSVNYDPGRWIKYLGSLMIVFGSIWLFYFKKMFLKKTKRPSGG